jgi:hypothetical protein
MGNESPRTSVANIWRGTKLVETAAPPTPETKVLVPPDGTAPRILTASLGGQDLTTCTQATPCTAQLLNARQLLNVRLDRRGYACVVVRDLWNAFPQPPGIVDGTETANSISFGGRGLFRIVVITSASAIDCQESRPANGGSVEGYFDVR